MTPNEPQQITIICSDGVPLAGSFYSPVLQPKAAVLIGPATGIKRQFYHSFCTNLANHGYAVLSFDNRGIGQSRQGKIKRSDASLKCWGELDLPAALDALKQQAPNLSYHLVGHSAGGQLIGLMANAHDLTSQFNFACSSGNLSNMKLPFLFSARFFMDLFIPVSNAVFGHTKSQWVGMGEPLPKKVAQQWRHWCNGQGYVKTDFGKAITEHCYDELTLPSMWVNATDDQIANNANVDDMLSVFPKVEAKRMVLHPPEHSLDEIGHMKFFSRQCQSLWPIAVEWLEQHH